MTTVEHTISEEYKNALDESYKLLTSSLDTLQAKNFDIKQLNNIQREIIFDSLKLVKSKNNFKTQCNDSVNENIETIQKNDSIINNSQLLKLEIQKFKNNQLWNTLNTTLKNLPDLNFQSIAIDEENESFMKSLDYPKESLHEMLWNKEDFDPASTNYQISDDVNDKITRMLNDSDIKKFRLVQLHDKYYQRKISLLDEMDKKWSLELNKIKNFISNDISRMKLEISEKLSNMDSSENSESKVIDSDEDEEEVDVEEEIEEPEEVVEDEESESDDTEIPTVDTEEKEYEVMEVDDVVEDVTEPTEIGDEIEE